eukprot:COSAG06_NODE_33627_length_487_cov_0.577320_1_plen_28_part_01
MGWIQSFARVSQPYIERYSRYLASRERK